MSLLLLFIVNSVMLPLPARDLAQAKSVTSSSGLSITSRGSFTFGAPIEIKVRLVNITHHEVNGTMGHIKGFCDAFSYEIHDQSGSLLKAKQIDPTHQGSAEFVMLKPGESREYSTNISEAYDLWPGTYSIQMSLPLPDDGGTRTVKSNVIKITVTP